MEREEREELEPQELELDLDLEDEEEDEDEEEECCPGEACDSLDMQREILAALREVKSLLKRGVEAVEKMGSRSEQPPRREHREHAGRPFEQDDRRGGGRPFAPKRDFQGGDQRYGRPFTPKPRFSDRFSDRGERSHGDRPAYGDRSQEERRPWRREGDFNGNSDERPRGKSPFSRDRGFQRDERPAREGDSSGRAPFRFSPKRK